MVSSTLFTAQRYSFYTKRQLRTLQDLQTFGSFAVLAGLSDGRAISTIVKKLLS